MATFDVMLVTRSLLWLLALPGPGLPLTVPTLSGPGFDCQPAFAEELNNLSLDSVLLCNKTSSGPGFKKTEIQALNSQADLAPLSSV